ncbi:hypothetical protein L3Q72_08545 [Vibrio sp. JC009]|uniref:hypothetical protein n=1 Tax=Vibrio sp. JC009 TaxID=2912314 RepID=UPI0023AFFCDD|nr:hypothetical protein [Vibrio sp. JC009]WED20692.1 hypothetical protein L3Q72_08545 [Vibrio sp. JC009]
MNSSTVGIHDSRIQKGTQASEVSSREISAAFKLFETRLKPGCAQLLDLNRILLKTERSRRIKQTLNRLLWVSGLSTLVIIVTYLTTGLNLVTVVGLLIAYFVGLILHSKFSPAAATSDEEHQLYDLNNQLREEILSTEQQNDGLIFKLLDTTELEGEARSKGFKLERSEIDEYQLDGSGLYQYLDAMNLVMEHKSQLEARL